MDIDKTNTIITIGRQYGSGGKEVGIRLARELGIPFYDKELLKRAADQSGLCEKVFENFDEKPRSLLFSIAMDPYAFSFSGGMENDSLEQKVYLATFDTIRRLADEGPCVIIGRCADYALRDYPNHLNLFLYAPLEKRIERVMRKKGVTHDKARAIISKTDKRRSSYYEYYSSQKWGAVGSYDYCLDCSYLGEGGTVELIREIIQHREHPRTSPTEQDPTEA
ncbi:MAG: cytidylate kinase-like family protein [Oscillospiraceae bacterium]